jgi:hypothetical protein
LFDETRAFCGEVVFKESHEGADLLGGAIPIFLGKGIDGEDLDAQFQAQRDELANRFDSLLMARDSRETPQFRPPSIAVHNDCEMLRKEVRIQFREQIGI